MSLSVDDVTGLAPDGASISAARKLMAPKKWFDHGRKDNVIWASCQGSGKNPYYVVSQDDGQGYKCSCPSRKFPCKHVLALLLQDVQSGGLFQDASVPDWVEEFMSRKKKAEKAKETREANKQNGQDGEVSGPSKAREKTAELAAQACVDLEGWIQDRLRLGLDALISDPSSFGVIAARMNDAKAQALGARLSMIPLLIKRAPSRQRIDVCVMELGRLVMLCRVFAKNAGDTRLMGEVTSSLPFDQIDEKNCLIQKGRWVSLGAATLSLPGNFMQVSTYLLSLESPELVGEIRTSVKVGSSLLPSFAAGSVIDAKGVFYPSVVPSRMKVENVRHIQALLPPDDWPVWSDAFTHWNTVMKMAPWQQTGIILLGNGRFVSSGDDLWYKAKGVSLPIDKMTKPSSFVCSCDVRRLVGRWDGITLSVMFADTEQMGAVAL